ncbi:hypothetical protein CGS27_23080 [Enterobacter cloacae]|nr:hypothetical protein CGS27_23080 [Enterobacter cloacae]
MKNKPMMMMKIKMIYMIIFFISVPSINDYIMKQYNINIIFKFIHKYLRKIESNKKTPCIRCFSL